MTLIDSRPGVIATFDALNTELGTDIDGRLLASRLGPTLESEMAAYFGPSEIDGVCDRFRELYAEFGPPGSSLLPGAADAIAAVRRHGGTVLVVTAKFAPNAHRCLEHVGLVVDHVVGWRHGPQKGETLVEHGAHLYIGDTIPDIAAALVAGATAIGVTTGPVARGRARSRGRARGARLTRRVPRIPRHVRRVGIRYSGGGAASPINADAYPVRVLLST